MKKNYKNRKGFTVLYAVLVSSLLLSIGASIFNISLKQILLTSTASESQTAIYAADSGLECAYYYEIINPDPSNTESAFSTSTVNSPQEIYCGNSVIIHNANFPHDPTKQNIIGGWSSIINTPANINSPASSVGRSQFAFYVSAPSCVEVEVIRYENMANQMKILVTSRGYNNCDQTIGRRVERTLQYIIDDAN